MAGLFTQCRDVAPNAAESVGSGGVAERARDLLLHLDHPQIALGLITIEGHARIAQEGQSFRLVRGQAVQQVARLALFQPPATGTIGQVSQGGLVA